MTLRFMGLVWTLALMSVGASFAGAQAQDQYIFAWFHDPENDDPSFVATIDANPNSPTYGEVLASAQAEGIGLDAHHTNHTMPASRHLFANDFMGARTHIFDLNDPLTPRRVSSFSNMGEFTFPHSFVELQNGNVLSTFQTIGQGNKFAGGLVEITKEGNQVRSAPAAVEDVAFLRPYSLEYLPEHDRVIMVSADMHEKDTTFHYQLWRASDLTLLGSYALPKAPRADAEIDPMEARTLKDNSTVMITTYNCGLYAVDGILADAPVATFVHDFKGQGCAIPLVIDDYWIEAVGNTDTGGGKLEVLDLSDPHHPKLVQSLGFPKGYAPHWIASDARGENIAMSGYGAMKMKITMLKFDPDAGLLSLDMKFGEIDAQGVPGITTERQDWPHGSTGPASPHGIVFNN